MTMLAAIGATAVWLLYVWLASAIAASYLSARKGYGEKPGLATGLLLSALAVVIWLLWPPRPDSAWRRDGPMGRRGRTGPERAEPERAEPERAEPERAEPERAEPASERVALDPKPRAVEPEPERDRPAAEPEGPAAEPDRPAAEPEPEPDRPAAEPKRPTAEPERPTTEPPAPDA